MSHRMTIPITILLLTGALSPAARSQPQDFYASQDIPVVNGGMLNDFTYTHESDDQYEGITELRTGGAPHEKMTYLIHKWSIPVNGGIYDSWAFHIEAHHTLTEGYGADDFKFAWSPDDVTYYNLVKVTKTSDDDSYQICRFYPPQTDTIYIRVKDTSSIGFKGCDTIFVDHMFIRNFEDEVPPVIFDVVAETTTAPAWVQLFPEAVGGTLEPRELHAMAYDSAADKTIMFGGNPDGPRLNDTWTYDYTANQWEFVTPEVVGGQLYTRNGHAMVYDSVADKVIMFGGWGGGHYEGDVWIPSWHLNDTWIFDYQENTWTNAAPNVVDGPLEGRWHHAMAYDPVVNLTIMVGGVGDEPGTLEETWVYDYSSNTWYNRTESMQCPDGCPPPLAAHFMAYDPVANLTILYGGWTPDGETNDTWAYDCGENTWYNMTPDMQIIGGTLTPRARHTMVYDDAIDRIVMFGGAPEDTGRLNDTWAYDYFTNTWQMLDPATAGGELIPREESAMVYDSAHSAIILFGGFKSPSPPFLGDTWMFTHEPTAVITWSTDEWADSVVRFGIVTPPMTEVCDGTMANSHSVPLRELQPYPTQYFYEVQSTDLWGNPTVDDNDGAYYTFTIGAPEPPNNPPDPPSDPSPSDGATDVPVDVQLAVYVEDADGDSMDVSFWGESNVLIGTVEDVPSGSCAEMMWEGLSGGTEYGWYAIADDSEDSTQSAIWHFTTASGVPGAMYVSDIAWGVKTAGPNTFLTHTVTVRYDSDQDGVPEETDALVNGATVYSTLTHTTSQDSWNFSGETVNGVVEFTQKVSVTGEYEAYVTDILHGVYYYEWTMDLDNPSYYFLLN